MVFLGRDYVITVRHGNHSSPGHLRKDLEADPEQLAVGPAVVLHAIVDEYIEVVDAFEGDIDPVETAVFALGSEIGVEQMYLVKRELMELRRAVMPLTGPLRKLSEGHCGVLIPDSLRTYFRDVNDHLTTVTERVVSFDELLTTLVDATLAKVSLQRNNDMRKISSWVAIIAVPTMIVGVYGMNFDHMPELGWRYGCPMILSITLAACLMLHRMFKRNRWL
ncbi:CorA-like Mg2+ transporter protein [Lentzea californiensis]|nr:CorA-like Mg2+ transporter protein [Lentzea californiensis]